jgi:hypothetical protein
MLSEPQSDSNWETHSQGRKIENEKGEREKASKKAKGKLKYQIYEVEKHWKLACVCFFCLFFLTARRTNSNLCLCVKFSLSCFRFAFSSSFREKCKLIIVFLFTQTFFFASLFFLLTYLPCLCVSWKIKREEKWLLQFERGFREGWDFLYF